jgi:TRAP-type C4-dicarboxylate transport system substrate-binding protein
MERHHTRRSTERGDHRIAPIMFHSSGHRFANRSHSARVGTVTGPSADGVGDEAPHPCRDLVERVTAAAAERHVDGTQHDVLEEEESHMRTARSTRRGTIAVSVFAAAVLAVTGCAGGGTPEATEGDDGGSENNPVTLTVATSQNEQTPNYYCGVELLKERLEEADLGFTVELYPASQLGPDADRFPLVQAGDIDIDLQGASALSSTFEPIGVVDATYAFDDVDHAFRWIDEGSEDLFTSFQEATGVSIVDGWFFGNRTFTTKDVEVRSPDDLDGVPIRFPNSPAFLANAEALGVTNPVSVAVEEVYTALQQGIAVGQENPIVATRSSSYDEILNVAVLNDHNVGIHWILVSDKTYEKMSDEQAALLEETIHEIRPENAECVDEATEEILDEYRANDAFTVIEKDDIDMDAFITKSEEFFSEYFTGESLEAYEAIREMAG